jgi:hypothetical protein
MGTDQIVDEVRDVRKEHAARFGYDLQAIVRDLQTQEKRSGRKYVTLPARKPSALVHSIAEQKKSYKS